MTEPKPKRNNRKRDEQANVPEPAEPEVAVDEPTLEFHAHPDTVEQLLNSSTRKVTVTALWQRPMDRQLLIEVMGKRYLYPASDWNGERQFEVDEGVLAGLAQPEDWALLFPDAAELIRDSFQMTGVVRRTGLDNAKIRYGLQRLVSTLAQRFSEYKE